MLNVIHQNLQQPHSANHVKFDLLTIELNQISEQRQLARHIDIQQGFDEQLTRKMGCRQSDALLPLPLQSMFEHIHPLRMNVGVDLGYSL